MKKRMRLGFTLIEVSLFLGITALLFVGVTIGTQNAISQQRHSDAINGFTDFIKNVYSEVSNPQSTGHGNSNKAIYGRLIVFGEDYSIDKEDNGRLKKNDGRRDIYVYDVLGDADGDGASDSLTDMLTSVKASVFSVEKTGTSAGNITAIMVPAGVAESYSPRWQSKVEFVAKDSVAKLALLIVRHPRSGTINTLVLEDTLEVNTALRGLIDENAGGQPKTWVLKQDLQCFVSVEGCAPYNSANNLLKNKLSEFTAKEVDLCLNIFGDGNIRRNVRIAENARNAAGVQIIDDDSTDNKCKL